MDLYRVLVYAKCEAVYEPAFAAAQEAFKNLETQEFAIDLYRALVENGKGLDVYKNIKNLVVKRCSFINFRNELRAKLRIIEKIQ